MLVISCHSDTGFARHHLSKLDDGTLLGHLDNYAGVQAVMSAYFSGRLRQDYIRIELTYGEEVGCLGAIQLLPQLSPDDLVVVVDVTGTVTRKDFCIEKCTSPAAQKFVRSALKGLSYNLYADCPDPVSNADEVDVYIHRCPHTFFLGVPVRGGDYNAGVVRCRANSLAAVSEAICRLAENFKMFEPRPGLARKSSLPTRANRKKR